MDFFMASSRNMEDDHDLMQKIVSLAKRRGFVFPGSEIYGGLAGTWDFGHYGNELKRRVRELWWQAFVAGRDDMFGIDSATLMNEKVWEASGHTSEFSDPLVECGKCKRRFRADTIEGKKCPECGGALGETRQFNMMFATKIGAVDDSSSIGYFRPETAQGMFVNFKNILDAYHPTLPFGIAQIGRAYRNEITPRDFIFRAREFEIMELEYFVRKDEWEAHFEEWRTVMKKFLEQVGISKKLVHETELSAEDRAHYSKRTVDFEFDYPFGRKELCGIAYRTDFDLANHMRASGEHLEYHDEAAGDRFIPHVIEPTFGLERLILAIFVSAYREDELGEGKRVYLAFPKEIAPVKAAVFPLLKNKPELVAKAREVYTKLKKNTPNVMRDDNGNIGKRYRRQDEIGTPFCITIDFETLENDTVTLRDRDSGEQERVAVRELEERIT